jgi:hypothetical protein
MKVLSYSSPPKTKMTEEFNLSEKIQEMKINGLVYLEKDDVKEFIRRFSNILKNCENKELKDYNNMLLNDLKELAGDKLKCQ